MLALLRSWRAQKRVLGALFMREIQTRWGRRNLGFGWILFEPLIFAFPVLAVWALIRSPFEHGGIPAMPFMWSGYLPILVFRHTVGTAMRVVGSNSAMLYHRAINPLDLVIGRCGLEVTGGLAATFFSFFALYTIGQLEWPANVTLFMVGNLYNAWWSFSVALIIAAASERSEWVEHLWAPVGYLYLPISGFMYLVFWLPAPVQYLVLTVFPSVHCYEMIRGGYFGPRIQVFYDVEYLTFVIAVLTLVGLWLLRDVRRHLEIIE